MNDERQWEEVSHARHLEGLTDYVSYTILNMYYMYYQLVYIYIYENYICIVYFVHIIKHWNPRIMDVRTHTRF